MKNIKYFKDEDGLTILSNQEQENLVGGKWAEWFDQMHSMVSDPGDLPADQCPDADEVSKGEMVIHILEDCVDLIGDFFNSIRRG